MKKRKQLEKEYNSIFLEHELLFFFNGDNEIIITGAPQGGLGARLGVSCIGLVIVSVCLIIGQQTGIYNTFVIGGCLLGLIVTGSPFISFYSKKHFQVFISQRLKQINITHGIARPYKRIDFSNIDAIEIKEAKEDNFINPEEGNQVISEYTFGIHSQNTFISLFKLSSEDPKLAMFIKDFGAFLSDFMDKKLLRRTQKEHAYVEE